MKISESWLREWVDTDLDTETIGARLTMAGLELDGIEPVAGAFDQVVVGEIISIEKHPDADKLNVCRVASGGHDLIQVVCGAPNARVGLKTAFALVGASLPDFKIRKAKLRGIESFGMLCSAKELLVDDDANGILELPADAPTGADIREYLQLDDNILEIDLTPNRADCLSVSGVARDLAAITRSKYKPHPIATIDADSEKVIDVRIDEVKHCPRYCARVIEGINPQAATPLWMKEKLRRSGIRSISPVVDITNFVLIELGQPMHAFDLATLKGGIVVRLAENDEKLVLLDEKEVALSADSLVIADHDQAIALAGIMGGLASSVTTKTQDILLESACFSADKIAGKARSYGLHTESSHRFERGVDPQMQVDALHRACELVIQVCGGSAGPVIDIDHTNKVKYNDKIQLDVCDIESKLGIKVCAADVRDMFVSLDCRVDLDDSVLSVVPPSFRYDLQIKEDLIEEVARLYGYDNIPLVTSSFQRAIAAIPETAITTNRLQQQMLTLGYQEVITYSFVDAKTEQYMSTGFEPVTLENPISSDLSVMRTSLLGGLLNVVRSNNRRQRYDMRLFETGQVFQQTANNLNQDNKLAGIITGSLGRDEWSSAERAVDFYDIKGHVESILKLSQFPVEWQSGATDFFHPGQSASLMIDGEIIGQVGSVHPQVKQSIGIKQPLFAFEIDLKSLQVGLLPAYQAQSKFQSVRRDLSLMITEDVAYQDIVRCVDLMNEKLITKFQLFDLYSGDGVKKGLKSVAFSLILQDFSRTLEEKDIDDVVSRITKQLHHEFGATLRE